MAKSYRLTSLQRATNVLMRLLLRLGLAPHTTMLLKVPGRRSGTPRSTPVRRTGSAGWSPLIGAANPVIS
jgi:hypothetical protein